MTDLSQAIWRKARRSAHNGGCVEIAANLDGVRIGRLDAEMLSEHGREHDVR